MSPPAGHPRSDASPQPLLTSSSHTLASRPSAAFDERWEGHSSQRPSSGETRADTRARDATEGMSSEFGETSTAESGGTSDLASRKHRIKGSGGFLLDAFPSRRTGRNSSRNSVEGRDVKGKSSLRHGDAGFLARLRGASGESPRSSPLASARVTEGRDNGYPVSTPDRSSLHADSTTSQSRIDETTHSRLEAHPPSEDTAPRANIDPDSIVHMALNLSESRRRNLSAGQLMLPSATVPKRITSARIPPQGSYANYGAGSSLRQYLNEQRRVSRNISPVAGRNSPSASRQVSASFMKGFPSQDQGPCTFSEATLARRDKARDYIELKIEYLRLLEFLPPLKPDSSAPGNFVISTSNVPGTPHAHLTRTPSNANSKYELGRPYNPLQFIRNRRVRARERKVFDHEPEEFKNVDGVREWVDTVEAESQRPNYRRQDAVRLPKYHPDHETSSAPVLPSRPRMGWVVNPAELLADVYWLEEGDNKRIIEDRHGRKLFPTKVQPKQDYLEPRSSREYPDKRRRSWDAPRASFEGLTGDESEAFSERGRKRRLLPQFRPDSPRRHKKGWRRSGKSEGSSDSEGGSRVRPGRAGDINIGPLELQMKGRLEKEARELEKREPDPTSPDHWGGTHPQLSSTRAGNTERTRPGSDGLDGEISTRAENPLAQKRKKSTTLSSVHTNESRSSIEGLDSSVPNSPRNSRFAVHIGADLSPPQSRTASGNRRPKNSRLDRVRLEENGRGPGSEPEPVSGHKKRSSWHHNDENHEGNSVGTAILAAPSAVKSLLSHRKTESMTSLRSPDSISRKDTRGELKDPKDPSSAVSRFFRGVRNEGSKVGDIIFRRDRPSDDSDTDSDVSIPPDEESGPDKDYKRWKRKPRPRLSRNATATTIDTEASYVPGQYRHLDLPSFRSSNVNQAETADRGYTTDFQLLEDPVSPQARARASSRSERFEKLAPPPMDLRSISGSSSVASSRPSTPDEERRRIKAVLERSGTVGRGGLPFTPLAKGTLIGSSGLHRNASRPALDGKRHWSITDGTSSSLHLQTSIVTKAEIARIRALLLCSGIKARGLASRAHNPVVGGPSPFLVRAAKIADASLIRVPKKEEHVLAARILVRYLESSTQALRSSSEDFRNNELSALYGRITELKSRVETGLSPRVREDGDEAVKISSEVAGSAPLAVKEITDEVGKIIRMRRRRIRWIARVGWSLVEWALLAVMWCVWFVVVMLRTVKGLFMGVIKVVRWFLWL